MRLRKLEIKDAPLMLEWMYDQSVVENLRTNFQSKTLDDCETFIRSSWDDEKNCNMAIVNEDDTYIGTVSLKNIKENSAEFGITIRKIAMGKGYAREAMEKMICIGFKEMQLEKIYWCVSPENKRAIRFYDKNGYERVDAGLLDMIEGYTKEQIAFYVWYLKKCKNQEY